LTGFVSVTGVEAHAGAFLSGPGTILRSVSDRTQPSGCVQDRVAGQVVSVNHDVMKPDRQLSVCTVRRTASVVDQIHARYRRPTMRWVRRVSATVWIFSCYTIYREIFRWHHMTKTLRFNPPPPLPGTDIQPRPGASLLAVCLGSVAAPLVFLTATMMERMRVKPGGTSAQTTNQQELTRLKRRPHLPQVVCPSRLIGPEETARESAVLATFAFFAAIW
jgi:hypothetical protein